MSIHVLRLEHDFEWVQPGALSLLRGETGSPASLSTSLLDGILERGERESYVDRLIAAGELHRTEQLLRLGWIWIAGTIPGSDRSVCFPLVSVPVAQTRSRISKLFQIKQLTKTGIISVDRALDPVGDPALANLIAPDEREQLRGEIERDDAASLESWGERAVRATGLPIDVWHDPAVGTPFLVSRQPGLAAFAGVGLYLERVPARRTLRHELLSLATIDGLNESALGTLYGHGDFDDVPVDGSISVRPRTQRQQNVATAARSSEIAVISGAPGTGKTHVITSLAIDAVAEGQLVLVAGSTSYSSDVLLSHFAELGSVRPVPFGSSGLRRSLAQSFDTAVPERSNKKGFDWLVGGKQLDATFEQLLEALEARAQELTTEREAFGHRAAPDYAQTRVAMLERAGDLDELSTSIDRYFLPTPRDLLRNHDERVEESLDVDLDQLRKELRTDEHLANELRRRVADLRSIRGAVQRRGFDVELIRDNLDAIVRLGNDVRRLRAERLHLGYLNQMSSRRRNLRYALYSEILNNNREERARRIRRSETTYLEVAPLWVGSVDDIDILPQIAGLFDLVIIDEAAQLTQPAAAGALVRAKHAILCGDPQQLRHEATVTAAQVREATERFGTDPDVLDVANRSILDVALAEVPSQLLDEHFRSAPHLIEFSIRRFYGRHVKTVTRHPINEAADHIHVEVVDGAQCEGSGDERVNLHEVARCMRVAKNYIDKGCRSIGFISPFTAQARQLEQTILDEFSLSEIETYGLRVGTVRGFQGDEADVTILSWAIGGDEPDDEWEAVNIDAFFNVMVTRARNEVVVVTSNPSPPGLAGEHVQWAEPLDDLVTDEPSDSPWVHSVADALSEYGVPTRVGYRVGHYIIDIVAGAGADAVGIDCIPPADHWQRHLERSVTLRSVGWELTEAFEHMWFGRADEFVIELLSMYPQIRASLDSAPDRS